MYLRQSTAGQEILLGPFLDDTDGNTAETALTIANTDIKLHKHGATTEANKNSGGATHIAAGRYYAVLDATDTNTLGNLEVNVHVAGALAVRRQYSVLPAVVFDALILGTDNLVVDLLQTAADKVWDTTARVLTANTNFNDPSAAAIRAEIDSNSTQLAAIDSRLPAALSSGRIVAAVEALGTSTAALNNLRDHALRAVPVTFTGGTTTTAVLDAVDGAAASGTDDVYNGRVLIFSAPAGLKDQACEITDYVGSTKTATISAVTTAVGATSVAVLV